MELDKFAGADDMIKKTLDKRARVQGLKETFHRDLLRS